MNDIFHIYIIFLSKVNMRIFTNDSHFQCNIVGGPTSFLHEKAEKRNFLNICINKSGQTFTFSESCLKR